MIYTSTTIQKFMDCPRAYYHNQIQGYFPKKRPEYIAVGSLFHQAMDIWASEGKEEARAHIRERTGEVFDRLDEFPDFDPDNLEVTEQVLLGMLDGYPYPITENKHIEMEFHAPYKGHVLAGRVDGMCQYGGRDMIFDYKTVGSLSGRDDEELLKRNFQASFYYHVLTKLQNYNIEGVQFIYVKRPELRQGKKENKKTFAQRIYKDYLSGRKDKNGDLVYYKRANTFRARNDQMWMRNLDMILNQIQTCNEKAEWPMHEISCKSWNRRCEFLPICNKIDGWEAWYDVLGYDVHPELTFANGKERDNGN